MHCRFAHYGTRYPALFFSTLSLIFIRAGRGGFSKTRSFHCLVVATFLLCILSTIFGYEILMMMMLWIEKDARCEGAKVTLEICVFLHFSKRWSFGF